MVPVPSLPAKYTEHEPHGGVQNYAPERGGINLEQKHELTHFVLSTDRKQTLTTIVCLCLANKGFSSYTSKGNVAPPTVALM